MIKMDFPAGTGIRSAIESAKAAATASGYQVDFIFNEVLVRVNANTEIHALCMDYHGRCRGKSRFTSIGPNTISSPEYKAVVVMYGDVEEVRTFINEFQRSSWINGAGYGADKFGGDISVYHEMHLPSNRALRDKVWERLISPAESEEST